MVENHKEILEGFFKHYPKDNECVITSDGQVFTKKAAVWAQRHADHNGLKIEIIKRGDVVASNEVEEIEIKEVNVSRMKKAELIAFAEENEIEIDKEGTNEVIRTQIQEFLDQSFNPETTEESEESETTEEETDSNEEHKPTNS